MALWARFFPLAARITFLGARVGRCMGLLAQFFGTIFSLGADRSVRLAQDFCASSFGSLAYLNAIVQAVLVCNTTLSQLLLFICRATVPTHGRVLCWIGSQW